MQRTFTMSSFSPRCAVALLPTMEAWEVPLRAAAARQTVGHVANLSAARTQGS